MMFGSEPSQFYVKSTTSMYNKELCAEYKVRERKKKTTYLVLAVFLSAFYPPDLLAFEGKNAN